MNVEFEADFRSYVCEGDTIEARASAGKFFTGLRFVATIYRDDSSDRPDERDDGFWPSLDPNSAGYIGPKSQATLQRHMRKARDIMAAWERDEWFYCGVAVRVWFDDIPLTGEFDHALWGIEANYPAAKGNPYLRSVANDLLGEAARDAIRRLTEIVERGAQSLEIAEG